MEGGISESIIYEKSWRSWSYQAIKKQMTFTLFVWRQHYRNNLFFPPSLPPLYSRHLQLFPSIPLPWAFSVHSPNKFWIILESEPFSAAGLVCSYCQLSATTA